MSVRQQADPDSLQLVRSGLATITDGRFLLREETVNQHWIDAALAAACLGARAARLVLRILGAFSEMLSLHIATPPNLWSRSRGVNNRMTSIQVEGRSTDVLRTSQTPWDLGRPGSPPATAVSICTAADDEYVLEVAFGIVARQGVRLASSVAAGKA
jgi:hypothetical protein